MAHGLKQGNNALGKYARGLVVAGMLSLGFNAAAQAQTQTATPTVKSWSEFVNLAERGSFRHVTISGSVIVGEQWARGAEIIAAGPPASESYDVYKDLKPFVPEIEFEQSPVPAMPREPSTPVNWLGLLSVGLMGAMVFFMFRNGRAMRQAGNGGPGGQMGLSASKMQKISPEAGRKTFADVAGVDEAREEVQEVVEFLKNPMKFRRLGAKLPKGVLLSGPPGTGKTLLARAVAGEAGVPFFSISGSDFVEKYVGVGASRVRELFAAARKEGSAVIFIDEIDAVAKRRGGDFGGNDERESTLNQLLVEMDGFEKDANIIIIGATNRTDVLDPAVLRPGRFDRQITVNLPDVAGRERILNVHARTVPLSPDVNMHDVARGTPGFSGADLANLVNEAAFFAARRDHRLVDHKDFMDARDRVLMGPEKKSAVISPEQMKLTAYHEAGHTLLMLHEKYSDPLHKVTIMPRGNALGMAMWLPKEGGVQGTFGQMVARLRVAAAGRVAEEIIFDKADVSGGASGDIQMMTDIAKQMVTELGLSEKIGMVRYAGRAGGGFLGGNQSGLAAASEFMTSQLEAEIKRLVDDAYNQAKAVLTEPHNLTQLHALAQKLMEKETMTAREVKELISLRTIEDPYFGGSQKEQKFTGPNPG